MTYNEWLKLIAESFHVSYSVARKMFFAMFIAGKEEIISTDHKVEQVLNDAIEDFPNLFQVLL